MSDGPKTLEDAAAELRRRGFEANVREWAMGRTVQAYGEPLPTVGGIRAFERIVWIVEAASGWEVVDLRWLISIVDRCTTLPDACERAALVLGPLWKQREETHVFMEVERIEEIGGRIYVFARQVPATTRGEVTAGVMLHGCAIDPWADVQQALQGSKPSASGLFAFRLRHNADRQHFQVGRLIALATVDEWAKP